jgi:hypothetical protein
VRVMTSSDLRATKPTAAIGIRLAAANESRFKEAPNWRWRTQICGLRREAFAQCALCVHGEKNSANDGGIGVGYRVTQCSLYLAVRAAPHTSRPNLRPIPSPHPHYQNRTP